MRIHVVGAGLIGTSIGLSASAVGWPVTIEDLDSDTAAMAQSLGAGETGIGAGADLIVVAVPPDAIVEVSHACLQLYVRATVIDVCGVKTKVAKEVAAFDSRFIPTHPMAGSEISGPRGARRDMFHDRPWVITPVHGSDPQRIELVEAFVSGLGAVVVRMPPVEHDAVVAATSHVPQVVSSALSASLLHLPAPVGLSGQALRDMTRIAQSDPDLWQQILTSNAGPVRAALLPVLAELTRVAEALNDIETGVQGGSSPSAVLEVLQRGNEGCARIPGRHGTGAEVSARVFVDVADRRGELARLFAAISDYGCNLDDVRIEHALGRPTGRVELTVDAPTAADLAVVLAAAGWIAAADLE